MADHQGITQKVSRHTNASELDTQRRSQPAGPHRRKDKETINGQCK